MPPWWPAASGRVRRHDMHFSRADLRELIGDATFLAGRRRERPRFGRFDYRQKFEYWAVLWGTALMVATGLIMWFPIIVTRWLPGVVIPASRVVHGGEALLALFAVIIWHFYNAHFRPNIFPMDPAMFTGKIPVERLRHEHAGSSRTWKHADSRLHHPPPRHRPKASPKPTSTSERLPRNSEQYAREPGLSYSPSFLHVLRWGQAHTSPANRGGVHRSDHDEGAAARGGHGSRHECPTAVLGDEVGD